MSTLKMLFRSLLLWGNILCIRILFKGKQLHPVLVHWLKISGQYPQVLFLAIVIPNRQITLGNNCQVHLSDLSGPHLELISELHCVFPYYHFWRSQGSEVNGLAVSFLCTLFSCKIKKKPQLQCHQACCLPH